MQYANEDPAHLHPVQTEGAAWDQRGRNGMGNLLLVTRGDRYPAGNLTS